jgi:hypothetical protein
MQVSATFTNHYGEKGLGYEIGNLTLITESEGRDFAASSGLPGAQYKETIRMRGGIIPPSEVLSANRQWQILTNPLDSSDIRGVEGNFYPITPETLTMSNGLLRGYFGVHADAGVLGSLGCIVLGDKFEWNMFELNMKVLRKKGIKSIPLKVIYYPR